MFGLAALDPEKVYHHLRRVPPAPDAAVDGESIAFRDDQAGLVPDGRSSARYCPSRAVLVQRRGP